MAVSGRRVVCLPSLSPLAKDRSIPFSPPFLTRWLGRGWADRMVLSHDANCVFDWFPQETFDLIIEQAAPNWNFSFIPGKVLGMLEEAGIPEEQIRSMTHRNPVRCLAG